MRSRVWMLESISAWSEATWSGLVTPLLEAWMARAFIFLRIEFISLSAPSAIERTLMLSVVLRTARSRPEVWARSFSEMTRSAGPSMPVLMR